MQALEELKIHYPLPAHWRIEESFFDSYSKGDYKIKVCGLQAKSNAGQVCTGSGVDNDAPEKTAYFELLERISILEAMPAESFRSFDIEKRFLGLLQKEAVFPESSNPESWQYSKSNAVAAGQNWQDACHHAMMECLERDVVLKSWYGFLPLQIIKNPNGLFWESHSEDYEFYSVEFFAQTHPFSFSVCGGIGFPKKTAATFDFLVLQPLATGILHYKNHGLNASREWYF